ncbi:MAG: CHAT domain-containing protein [Allosphingosinicella sp.]
MTPVILLTFANDEDDHLQMLTRERKSISAALSTYEDQRYIRVQVEPAAAVADVFGLFNRFTDQIAIFHYAGHADGKALQLETATGDNEAAHAGGLAKLMGLSDALQLVFLNGCATRGHVQMLLDNGVKAVIATQVPINDAMATEFAEQFYQALASGNTIKQSFDSACALIASRYDDRREIGDFRGMRWGDKPQEVDAGMTWGLYVHPEGESAVSWKLPKQAETQVIVRGAAFSVKAGAPVNEGLIEKSFNAVAPHSPEVGMLMEVAKRTSRQDLRTIRQQIVDTFPSPVGEQLRKLFASSSVDEARLRQLVITYETLVKLFCFTLLSQFWDAMYDNPGLKVTDEQWQAIEAFKRLDAQTEPTFDYLALTITIDQILQTNGATLFMAECATLPQQFTDAETALAHRFMEEMRKELATGGVTADEVESFCVQAETHLGTLLSDLAFLVRYKLATIKGIAIRKTRHKAPEFRHRQVLLDRVTAGFIDSDEIRAAFTDNESVILLKDLADVSQYLNLTPFVIDQNALTGNENTKIYFYSHFVEAQGACHYYSIADPSDRLVISDELEPALRDIYLPIRGLVQEFRDRVKRP